MEWVVYNVNHSFRRSESGDFVPSLFKAGSVLEVQRMGILRFRKRAFVTVSGF
jgi:hypothetical protein